MRRRYQSPPVRASGSGLGGCSPVVEAADTPLIFNEANDTFCLCRSFSACSIWLAASAPPVRCHRVIAYRRWPPPDCCQKPDTPRLRQCAATLDMAWPARREAEDADGGDEIQRAQRAASGAFHPSAVDLVENVKCQVSGERTCQVSGDANNRSEWQTAR